MIFGLMIWAFFVRFSVPVLGVFYGTSLMADEVEDKTITYLFTRPIPRGAVLVGKYLAYLACTVFVVLPAVVIVWLLIVPIGGSLGASFVDLAKDLGVLALGLAVYGAVFALIGAALKRPLLVGLIFVFGWEIAGHGAPGLPQALHGRLLPAGPRAPRHAERLADEPDSVVFRETPEPGRKPDLDGGHRGRSASGWRPGRWRGGNTSSSNERRDEFAARDPDGPEPRNPEPRNPRTV